MTAAEKMKSGITTAKEFHAEFDALKARFASMKPELSMTVSDPEMGVEGYVVVWNTKISHGGPVHGMGKGGTRCLSTLDLQQVERLASTMAIKNAAAGMPLGGCKSGVKLDKKDPDYEKKFRRFVELTAPVLHENGGPFGGYGYDVGCHIPDNAIWAVDELKRKKLGSERSHTGKPVELGGTDYDREGIAGLGVAVAMKTLLETQERSATGVRYAIQGMGAMGSGIYRYFSEYGGELAAISDLQFGGSWVIEKPLTAEMKTALAHGDFATSRALLPQFARKISDDVADVLYQDVEALFPAAVEDVITAANVAKIKARYISEGANNPTTDEAHAYLFEHGVMVVPDVIANAGGIIAAFVEMTIETTPEVIASRLKVQRAKDTTIDRVATNTRELVEMVARLKVQPDKVGDFMAYRNIFYGLP